MLYAVPYCLCISLCTIKLQSMYIPKLCYRKGLQTSELQGALSSGPSPGALPHDPGGGQAGPHTPGRLKCTYQFNRYYPQLHGTTDFIEFSWNLCAWLILLQGENLCHFSISGTMSRSVQATFKHFHCVKKTYYP